LTSQKVKRNNAVTLTCNRISRIGRRHDAASEILPPLRLMPTTVQKDAKNPNTS